MYSESELVAIARRENNSKRNYLVINRFQGKHIPVAPSKALKMFYELGGLVKKAYAEERLLIIGFAETATAIGGACSLYRQPLYADYQRKCRGSHVSVFYRIPQPCDRTKAGEGISGISA